MLVISITPFACGAPCVPLIRPGALIPRTLLYIHENQISLVLFTYEIYAYIT